MMNQISSSIGRPSVGPSPPLIAWRGADYNLNHSQPRSLLSRAEYTVHLPRITHRHITGLTRREVLQVGYSALAGIGLPSLLAHQGKVMAGSDRRPAGRARTVVFV